jgi:hypothetical protein
MGVDLSSFDDLLRQVPEPGRTALWTSITVAATR